MSNSQTRQGGRDGLLAWQLHEPLESGSIDMPLLEQAISPKGHEEAFLAVQRTRHTANKSFMGRAILLENDAQCCACELRPMELAKTV